MTLEVSGSGTEMVGVSSVALTTARERVMSYSYPISAGSFQLLPVRVGVQDRIGPLHFYGT